MSRVGWDARVLAGPHLRGIGTYAVHLLQAMRTVRPSLEVVLFADEPIAPAHAAGREVRVVGPSRGYRWQLWEQWGLPWHAWRAGVDLLHSPANTCPRRSRVPRIVTVHDVIPYMPEIAGNTLSDNYWHNVVPAAVQSADAIITDSEWSRDDITRVFHVSPDRIVVVPLAVEQCPEGLAHAVLPAELGLGDAPFVMALAASARRKNLPGVMAAFAELARQDADVRLVLTGVTASLAPVVEELRRKHGIDAARIRALGFVESAVRDALYARARAFLFLTLYEGFGLPILEAMRAGAPVVCSNRSSCPEVAGDAALLVDPSDAMAAAEAMGRLTGLTGAERDGWVERGKQRAAAFSWERTARETLEVYDRVAG